MSAALRFAAVGLDHRHIYGMAQGMLDTGAEFAGWWTEGDPVTLPGFIKRFPDTPRVQLRQQLLDDESISLVLIAAPPSERAALAIEAMSHGKDVMLDKPGCITSDELLRIKKIVADTGRIWSVNFSERFEVPSVTRAYELVQQGQIGQLVQTVSLAPHRLNLATRPDWFFDSQQYGGILADIGTHQIDQFLHFSGAETATVEHSAIGNFANPELPMFQDFGEINFTAGNMQGYTRLDWYTADALPNWGDGRLFLLGTEGSIELRKYVDVAGLEGTDHLYLVNKTRCEHIDCKDAPLPYFNDLAADVGNRTETACTQRHTFNVTELALLAQSIAQKRGNLLTSDN
ncbi:MAG: Gfo/Idh/MocA family protein [Granulosicoccus sp.]